MRKNWLTLGLVPAAVAIGLVFNFVVGLRWYMAATATPFHPNGDAVQSVSRAAPAPKWVDAVEKARQIVRAHLSGENLPGISVAVGIGGDIVWAEGFGYSDLETRAIVTPETRFRIGTASVPLTSAAVGLLLEKGRLQLDEEIQKYVPDFPEKQWPVTLRQLMAHVAGVRNDGGDEGPLFSQHCERPVDALPFFADRSLLFEPETQFRYSSYGWILVSAAVEAAAGEPFLAFMRNQIFAPLAMNDTTAESSMQAIPNRPTFYFPRFAADPNYGLHAMRPIDLSCYAGSSVFLSTPSDLVRFAISIEAGKLLQPATVQLLQTSPRLASGQETGYGLGWDLETVTLAGEQARATGHDGDVLGGMVASLLTFPQRALVVAAASNISYANTAALSKKIADAFAAPSTSPASR